MFTNLKLKKIDKELYQLKEPLQYGSHIVPIGYRTNLASIPPLLTKWFKKTDRRWIKSSIVHDYLYECSDFSRLKCDWIFLKALKDENSGFFIRWSMYILVRIFGGFYK
ncbi:MAG: DUF1353 domain-containing protein [Campylobacterota bacterium]|nr:DUF1353 domain-containing protein [Campylobacterota bacterium]